MKNRILLLGSAGQLGTELLKALSPSADLVALNRRDVDFTDRAALRNVIRSADPRFIVNAAAYTAVDRAESEPGLAHSVNAQAPQIMAEEALRLSAWLVHFSTDYVFDGIGNVPWKETDRPSPLNVYGRTKLAGEQAIAQSGCRYLIFRTSWVYAAHGNSFLRTMLRLGAERPSLNVVNDQIGAPTSAREIASAVRAVHYRLHDPNSQPPQPGIYHMTCAGEASWFDFATAIFASSIAPSPPPTLHPIPTEQYPTPAVRPRNSRLNCDKLAQEFALRLPPWQDALNQVIAQIEAER